MAKKTKGIDVIINELTNSLRHSVTGEILRTEVLLVLKGDLKKIKRKNWEFDWGKEFRDENKQLFKLVISNDAEVIQGLISLEDKGDHIFMHLIESAQFNKGKKKLYIGAPGNLVALACKLSFERGYDGFLLFKSKTNLIEHYKKTLGEQIFRGDYMVLDSNASRDLRIKYFPEI